MATGIPPSVWLDEGARAIATASEILDEMTKDRNSGPERG